MPGNLAGIPMAAPVDVDVHEHGTITAVDVTVLAGAVVGKTFSSRVQRGAPALPPPLLQLGARAPPIIPVTRAPFPTSVPRVRASNTPLLACKQIW